MPQAQESARLQRKRQEAATRQAQEKAQKKPMDPITALRSKIAEMLKDPDADQGVITLLRDKLRQLMEQKDPASAMAEKIQQDKQMLQKMTGRQ
jgi:hypothetical protein